MGKIFIFNIGMDSVVEPLKETLSKLGHVVELGPTRHEHKYLKRRFAYYANASKDGNFAAMSNVWRVYKLSNSKGLYIDTSVKIGPDFNEFYKLVSSYNAWVPRAYDISLSSSVMFGHHSKFMYDLLEGFTIYNKFTKVRKFPNLSDIMSAMALDRGIIHEGKFGEFMHKQLAGGPLSMIRDNLTIYKIGGGNHYPGISSFSKKQKKSIRHWQKLEVMSKNKQSSKLQKLKLKKITKKYIL